MRYFITILMIGIVLGFMSDSSSQAQSGGSISYGSKVYGTISAEMPLVSYSFSGISGDYVTITADSWTGTLDIQIDLIAPDGLILAHSTQNTPASEPLGAYLSVFLSGDGVYVLRISGENATTGDYLLTVLGRSAVESVPLIYGQPVDVSIPQAAEPQFFSFETETCPTTLVITETQPFPFVVKVRDQRGHTVALLRGGDQLEDWITVQADSGWYEVEVSSADPTLTGSIRLLVTCSGDNPGCPSGTQSGEAMCTPCPGPDTLVPGGGCPDLHLTPHLTTDGPPTMSVSWDPMPGADGYTVYVTGITADGGTVYITHSDWIPGNPTEFTWDISGLEYVAYDFTLHILVGGETLCTQQAHLDIEQTASDCPDLGLTGVVTDESVNAVTLSWPAGLGADQFALDMYSLTDAGEEYSGRLILPADATGRVFDHFPPHLSGVRFVLWMTQAGRLCSDEITVTFMGEQSTCPDLGLVVTSTDTAARTISLSWSSFEGVPAYELDLYGTAEGGAESVIYNSGPLPAGLTTFTYTYPEGYIGFRFVLRMIAPLACSDEISIGLQNLPAPCAIRADREGVPVRVGPGITRSIFGYLNPGIEYTVIGQAVGDDGEPWWEVDKTQFAGHEGVLSLWIAQSDVTALGDCGGVPQGDIPDVIPDDGGDDGDGPSAGWLPCGSCDTCGHPASECVTSPEGICLWDPATCLPPGDDPDDGGSCHAVRAAIDMGNCFGSGSAMIDIRPNCEGGLYTPGTTIQAHALAVDSKCVVQSWSGCGASGSGSNISFIPPGSCTITAHMGY